MASLLLPQGLVAAQPDGDFELPAEPDALEPVLSGNFHVALLGPVSTLGLCPSSGDCVLGVGGGVGAIIERRWPFGPAVGLGYELLFFDANGVFEVGVLQELRAQARYRFLQLSLFHPFVGGGVGALVFGDSFEVSTAGASILAFVGVEVELTEVFSVSLSVPVRVFWVETFTSDRDSVRRAEDTAFDVTMALQLGLSVTEIR